MAIEPFHSSPVVPPSTAGAPGTPAFACLPSSAFAASTNSRDFLATVCTSSSAAQKTRNDSKSDVIVVDLNLPCVHGLEARRQIKQVKPGAKIIVLSASNA